MSDGVYRPTYRRPPGRRVFLATEDVVTLAIQNSTHAHTSTSLILEPDITQDLVGQWRFSEATATTRNDSFGANHAADIGSGVTKVTPGLVGTAAAGFNESAYLAVPDNVPTSITGDLSFSVEYEDDATATLDFTGIMAKWGHTDQRSYAVYINRTANRFTFQVSADGTGGTGGLVEADTFGNIPAGIKVCIQGYVDLVNDEIAIRVNGGAWDIQPYTASGIFNGTAPLEFGRFGTSGNVVKGVIDAPWLWARRIPDVTFDRVLNGGAGLELNAPVSLAGLDQTRMELETVYLDGSQSTGDTLTYLWSQVSGTSVTLIDGTTITPHFIAPDVATPETLVFQLEVEDVDNDTATDQVSIRIVPTGSSEWLHHTPQEAHVDPDVFYATFDSIPNHVLIARDGRVVGQKGDVTLEGFTWSASKMLTALIAARQIHLNNIELTDTIPNSDVPTSPTATLFQFLNMTSDYGLDQPSHSPGDHYAYNNASVHHYGTHLKTTFYAGLTHVQTLQAAYVTALDFEDTLGYNTAGFMSGWDGGWSMSTRDLARVAQLVLQGGVWEGTQILDPDFCSTGLWQQQIPEPATQSTDEGDEFFNQAATSAVMKDDWSLGFWYLTPDGIQQVTEEFVAMFGLYGTDVYISRTRKLIAVSCNTGGVSVPSPSPRITAAQVATIVAASDIELVIQNASHAHTAADVVLETAGDLVIQNSSLAHTADSLTLTQVHTLTIADSSHAHSAENLALTQVHSLAVQDAAHSHSVDNVALTQAHGLVVDSAAHAHTAESLTLVTEGDLAVANSTHSHAAANVVLTQVHELVIADSGHAHTADNLVITQVHGLVVDSVSHDHAVESLLLTQAHVLTVQNADHSHTADNLALGGAGDLVVQSAVHDHAADSLLLTQVHSLNVDNATHAHDAQSPTLTQVHNLAIQAAAHGHVADNLELSTPGVLGIQNAAHAHTSENVALTQDHQLAVADSSHTHTGESLTLVVVYDLVVQSADHSHTAEGLVLTQLHILAVDNGLHSHIATDITLGQAGDLEISDSVHASTSTDIDLTQDHQLVIASSEHAHSAESLVISGEHNLVIGVSNHAMTSVNITLTQAHELVVADSVHGHTADNVHSGSTGRTSSSFRFATGSISTKTDVSIRRGR